MRTTGHTTNKISKKLWRGQRSKSQSRGQSQISSPWSPPSPLDNKVRIRSLRGHFSLGLRTKTSVPPSTRHSHKIFFNIRNILGNIFKSICHYLWLTSSFSESQKKTNSKFWAEASFQSHFSVTSVTVSKCLHKCLSVLVSHYNSVTV